MLTGGSAAGHGNATFPPGMGTAETGTIPAATPPASAGCAGPHRENWPEVDVP